MAKVQIISDPYTKNLMTQLKDMALIDYNKNMRVIDQFRHYPRDQ